MFISPFLDSGLILFINVFLKYLFTLIICIWIVCMYLCLGTMCAQEGQQRVSDPVSLEPQLGVSCYVVLRSKPGSPEEQAKLFVTVFSLQLSASFF